MIVIDGYIGNDPEFRTPARLYIEAANANIAAMQQQLYFEPDDVDHEPELTVVYTPNLEGRGLCRRPADRRRPGAGRDARLQLRLLRRVEEGRPPHVEQARPRPGRPAAARRLQDHPDPPRPPCRPDRRALGHRQDDDDLHAPERLAARPGRLRRVDARRPDHGDRERLFRQDLRAQSRRRADDLRRGHPARLVPRERLAARRRGRLLRHELHAERAGDLPVRRHRVRRRRGDRRGPLPPHPEPEREHHPGSGEARGAAGSGLLHARRDAGHERGRRRRGREVPARAGHEPVLPDAARPPGEPLPRAARGASARGVPDEHRPGRRR